MINATGGAGGVQQLWGIASNGSFAAKLITALPPVTSWQFLLYTFALGGALIWLQAVYNVFLHPLAQVPGPVLCKVSGLPSYYHALRGDRHIWLWQLSEVYGTRIRVEPNTVVFSTPEAFDDIYNSKASVRKSAFYPALRRNADEQNTITVSDPATHARRRRALGVVFTEKSLRAASGFVVAHVDRWVELLAGDGTEWSPPTLFSDQADYLFFDIITDLFFGRSVQIKEPGENPWRGIPHAIAEYLQFWYPIARSPLVEWIPWLQPRGLDWVLDKLTPPEVKNYFRFINEGVQTRLALETKSTDDDDDPPRQDMFHFLHTARDPDTGHPHYDSESLWAEANMLVLAGFDTSSIALAGLVWYLVRSPYRLDKLSTEIRHTFPSSSAILPGPQLQACTYLRACIDEALRLVSGGLSELPREVLAPGLTVQGVHYPAGTILGVSPYLLTRNVRIFHDPTVFRPERWIPDPSATGVTDADVARLRSSFHPFWKGPVTCPGYRMALMELSLAAARLVWSCDLRLAEGDRTGEGGEGRGWGRRDPNVFQMDDAYIGIRSGPVVQVRRRV